jgi:hypothetical protein
MIPKNVPRKLASDQTKEDKQKSCQRVPYKICKFSVAMQRAVSAGQLWKAPALWAEKLPSLAHSPPRLSWAGWSRRESSTARTAKDRSRRSYAFFAAEHSSTGEN